MRLRELSAQIGLFLAASVGFLVVVVQVCVPWPAGSEQLGVHGSTGVAGFENVVGNQEAAVGLAFHEYHHAQLVLGSQVSTEGGVGIAGVSEDWLLHVEEFELA